MLNIRAKSVLKVSAPTINLDYTYPKGVPLQSIVNDLLGLLIRHQGKAETKKMLNEKLANYSDEGFGVRDAS